MMNIYTGNVTTDSEGFATVHLPDWFEAVNTDFRYQLTVIGQFAQAIVSSKVASHWFGIRTWTKPELWKFPGKSRASARMPTPRRIHWWSSRRRTRANAATTFIPNCMAHRRSRASSGRAIPQ